MTDKYQGSIEHLANAEKARIKAYSKKECKHCRVSMATGALARHEASCLHDDNNIRECKNCGVRIFDLGKITFCSRSCSAVFNNAERELKVIRKPKHKVFTCLYCNEVKQVGKNSQGRFCNNTCQNEYQWLSVKEQISNGNVKGVGKDRLRRYLTETKGYCCSKCSQGSMWNGELLTLDMDHINGDRANNHPDNLRFLCPNCHTQTATWGKKKRIHGE